MYWPPTALASLARGRSAISSISAMSLATSMRTTRRPAAPRGRPDSITVRHASQPADPPELIFRSGPDTGDLITSRGSFVLRVKSNLLR
jgi:hypothetical protein